MRNLSVIFLLFPMIVFSCWNQDMDENTESVMNPISNVDTTKTRIVIDKSNRKLHLWLEDSLLRTYPMVLGFNPVDDKKMEGDGCTPEGKFKIRSKYPHKKWSKFMWVDYPTEESWEKFNAREAAGELPAGATIGGEIGIHGVPDQNDGWIDEGKDWTLGCISLKTADVNELYDCVGVGTVIEIIH